jgi:hypothetical protein
MKASFAANSAVWASLRAEMKASFAAEMEAPFAACASFKDTIIAMSMIAINIIVNESGGDCNGY